MTKPAHSANAATSTARNSDTSNLLTIGNQQYDLTEHTPMMVQYLTIKAQYPNALLLYRMGDFYELFFEDAKLAADILDITLTRRGVDKAGNEIAMAGVPFHAADSYMARLIAAGQTVVVCEQVEDGDGGVDVDDIDSADAKSNKNGDKSTAKSNDKQDKQNKNSAKQAKKGIMHREVVRTLTAGTLTDDALIAPNHTPTVAAIDMTIVAGNANTSKPYQAAVSQLDLTAGKITSQAITSDTLADLQAQILTVLARFAPSECIISEALTQHAVTQNTVTQNTAEQNDERNNIAQKSWQQWLEQQLNCPLICVAAADFYPKHAPATLCQQFAVRQLDGLGIANQPLIQTTAAALVHYARQTQQRQIPHVNQIIVEQNNDYLIIDAVSQRNLEIFECASPQGMPLISVINHCKTPMGKRLLTQQLKRPLRKRGDINQRLDAISVLLSLSSADLGGFSNAQSNLQINNQLHTLQNTLSAIGDIERISSRIGLKTAKPRDLKRLTGSIVEAQRLQHQLMDMGIGDTQSGLLPLLMLQLPNQNAVNIDDSSHQASDAKIISPAQVAQLIDNAIVDEPPAHIRDGGMIAKGFDSDFDRLTHLHDNIEQTLEDMANNARQQYQLPSLKVGFNKVSGFYFELPKAQAAKLQNTAPNPFIRRQTLKNTERFITDELKELESDYLGAQSKALAKEKQLYKQLLDTLSHALPQLQQLAYALAQIDVLVNWAQLAQKYQWQRPNMLDEAEGSVSRLQIIQGRHAVVEAAIKQPSKSQQHQGINITNHFVANDCQLGTNEYPQRLLLITGPNMGGKSTYMRQTALIVLLACCGSFVPAKTATIGNIDRIFTRIGAADDLAGGKSTFMVEMMETAHILNLATPQSLVLMDEIGRGTSTTDGLAIAHACVEQLANMGCLTLFATHYFELTKLADGGIEDRGLVDRGMAKKVRNVHVAASQIDGQLLLLHKIQQGAANSSFGLHVAKMAGVPKAVLDAAAQYLTQQVSVSKNAATNANVDLTHAQPDLLRSDNNHNSASNAVSANLMPEQTKQPTLPNQLTNMLAELDPDELTPKQAHDTLYQLKKLMGNQSH